MQSDPKLTRELIREELDYICSSPEFADSATLTALLRYLVEEVLEGRGEEIDEGALATNVLNRTREFDPDLDAAVSLWTGRLRRALRRYFRTAGAGDPVRIELPKDSLAPVFVAVG